MDYRLPYYMAYPMPFAYDDEKKERRDYDYMKSMYPMAIKRLLPFVEEESERMSYEGSMIYDEYPDKLQIYMMIHRIYQKAKSEFEKDFEEETLKQMIHILLSQELMRRRGDRRRTGRKYY